MMKQIEASAAAGTSCPLRPHSALLKNPPPALPQIPCLLEAPQHMTDLMMDSFRLMMMDGLR